MYETIRIVGKLRPKYVMWENVKNLLSKKHRHNFEAYIETMNILGYNSYYQVLNAKDYGIPQNRDRVYTISIRKDIDKGGFVFPEKEELKLRLKDMLENEVDEKYYLSDTQVNRIKTTTYNVGKTKIYDASRIVDTDGLAPTVKENHGTVTAIQEPQIITHNITQTVKVRKHSVDTEKLKQTLRDNKNYSNKEIAEILEQPITTVEHWFRNDNCFSIPEPNIWFKLKKLLRIDTDEFDESIMTFEEKDGVYDKANRVYDEQGLAPTLTQQEEKIVNNLRIRKLTPKEYWRLMGFDDTDFEKAEKVNSNTQLYKQAGNSIVVNVLEKILQNLLEV